jgi:hypothetical protein
MREVLDVNLADDTLAWTLGSDGRWQPVKGEGDSHAHQRFRDLAVSRARWLDPDDDDDL